MGLERDSLHFLSNIAGNPSGPPAELLLNLSIAFSMSTWEVHVSWLKSCGHSPFTVAAPTLWNRLPLILETSL